MNRAWYVPEYNHLKFCEVYGDLQSFLDDYNNNVAKYLYKNPKPVSEDGIKTIYFLLYSKYGNNPIINEDVNQFKFKLFVNIFAYGPLWEKKIDIQDRLLKLPEDVITVGAKQIYNHAFNPSEAPSTSTLEEIQYINDQNVASHKKGIIEAYSYLWENLHASATEEFLGKFKNCFSSIVSVDHCVPFYIEEIDIFDNN